MNLDDVVTLTVAGETELARLRWYFDGPWGKAQWYMHNQLTLEIGDTNGTVAVAGRHG